VPPPLRSTERGLEQIYQGKVDVTAEIFSDDYLRHDLRPSQAEPGSAGMAKIAADFRVAFPDLSFKEDLVVAEGDLVVARWTAEGPTPARGGRSKRPGSGPSSQASTSSDF
jgi:predicted ester cyclase